jgi:vancomycin resistance protein YoaR
MAAQDAPVADVVEDNKSTPAPEQTGGDKDKPVTGDKPLTEAQKYKVKVEEEELEVSLEDLLKNYQHTSSIGKTRREIAEEKKNVEAIKALAKGDPRKFLSEQGVDLEKFQADLLREQIELANMSEEGRELHKLKRQMTEKEKQEETSRQAAELEHVTNLVNTSLKEYSDKIVNIAKETALPLDNANNIRRIGHYLYVAKQNDIEVSAQDIGDVIREDIIMDINEHLKTADDDSIVAMLGEDVITRIVKGYNKKVGNATQRRPAGTLQRDPNKPARGAEQPEKHYVSEAEWAERKKARRGE